MKTPETIRISEGIGLNTKTRRSSNRGKTNKKRRRKRKTNNVRKGNKHNKTQRGGTSVLPTALVNIYDSIIYGIYNFANVLQGVEETVSPLPYLDHF